MEASSLAHQLAAPFPERELVQSTVRHFGVIVPDQLPRTLADVAKLESVRNLGIIAVDAVRCGATIVAAFAEGATAAVIHDKSRGLHGEMAFEAFAEAAQLRPVYGGELFGKAIEGSSLRNSPLAVPGNIQKGDALYFLSSNLGRVIDMVQSSIKAVGNFPTTDIYLASYANKQALTDTLTSVSYDAFCYIACGVKGSIAIEDMHLCGQIIEHMDADKQTMNAEAILMKIVSESDENVESLCEATPAFRLLRLMGHGDDARVALDSSSEREVDVVPKTRIGPEELIFKC